MAKTYNEYSKDDWVYQPNSIRTRSRFRGPRESYKVNLKNAQFFYDIQRIFGKLNLLSEAIDEHLELVTEGGEVEGVEFLWSNNATPVVDDVILIGLTDLTSKLDNMSNRIRRLEEI